jgi:hypothetical protein
VREREREPIGILGVIRAVHVDKGGEGIWVEWRVMNLVLMHVIFCIWMFLGEENKSIYNNGFVVYTLNWKSK